MSRKPQLVLLPALLCDQELWAHQAKSLTDLAEITVPDLTKADTMKEIARSVLANAPAKFSLAGLSMGGYVAQEIMRQAPERVNRLALVDTSPYADTPEQTERRRNFIEMTRHGQFKGVTTRLLPMYIHPDRLQDKELIDTIQGMSARVGKEAFLRQQNAIITRPDGLNDLNKITCPTLIMCGRQDTLSPLAVHEEMADRISTAKLVVIEDCGHLSTLERPYAVTAALRYWMQVE